MHRLMAIAILAILGGCGGGDEPGANDQSTAASAIPAASTANMTADCDARPDFVPVYAGAKFDFCVTGKGVEPGRESGTVVYTTSADPKSVKGWAIGEAVAKGLVKALDSDTPSAMFSARSGDRRSLMVIAEPDPAGSRITVNWGRQKQSDTVKPAP